MNELDAIKARREAISHMVRDTTTRRATAYDAQATAAFIAAAPADIDTLLAEVERLTAQRDAKTAFVANSIATLNESGLLLREVTAERDAQAIELAYLRSYVHALERYVPEAGRRVAAGEARAALEQQGEAV